MAEGDRDEGNVLCQSGKVDEDLCQNSDIYFRWIILKGIGRENEAFAAFKDFITFQERAGFDAEQIKGLAFSMDEEFASRIFDPNTIPDGPQSEWYRSLRLEYSFGAAPGPSDYIE